MRSHMTITLPLDGVGEIAIDGLRFSPEVLSTLAPEDGEWTGPVWIRRAGDVAEISTVDPNGGDGYVRGFKIGDGL